jgi:hypothetical protein
MVITTGSYGLDDGTKVKVGPAEADDDAKPAAGKAGDARPADAKAGDDK